MRPDEASHEVRAFAMSLPGAWEDHPWGETVVKVKAKVFVFLGVPDDSFGLSVKLPTSAATVLTEPFAKPTGYGLGKAGWVSCTFEPGDDIPIDRILAWVDESYRAVAPKKLVKELDGKPLR